MRLWFISPFSCWGSLDCFPFGTLMNNTSFGILVSVGICQSRFGNKFWRGSDWYTLSSVQSLRHVWLFVTPWTEAHPPSLPITNSQSLLKLMSIEVVMPSNHSHPLSSPSPAFDLFPASGSFPMSQFFVSDGQIIGTSASVLPMNIHDWFPSGLTGLISLLSKGLSRVFSNTIVQKHEFFIVQLSHPYMTTGKRFGWRVVLFPLTLKLLKV